MDTTISALKPLGSERFLAVLSDGREIRVSTAIAADLSLCPGRTLSGDEVSELEAASRSLGCKERALRIIGARAMSCKELYDRLVQKGEAPEAAGECIAWLLERRYLDDAQYAVSLVRHYAGKGYGAQRVKSELYRRGIDKSLWDEALEGMPEMEGAVYRQLCVRLKTDDPDRAELKRATDALFRRGHSWDEIKSAVNRFREEHPGND